MAATASALARHLIISLDRMLAEGRLKNSPADLQVVAKNLLEKLFRGLPTVDNAEHLMLDEHAQQWLAKLLQILYQADHFVDKYGEAKRPSALQSIIDYFWTDKFIKQRMKTLNQNMDDIFGDCPDTVKSSSMRKDELGKSCHDEELIYHDNFVGTNIECGLSTMVEKLTEGNENDRLLIFAMYGMGGVGKTTIAQKIFDDQRTKSAFSTRLWVSISKGFIVTELFSATTRAAGQYLKGSETRNELKRLLTKKIEGMRIFLVLDDINNALPPEEENTTDAKIYENLVDLLMVLCGGAKRSSVLITSNDENVAKKIKSAQIHRAAQELFSVRFYRLQKLTVEESWTLLLKALEQVMITGDLKDTGLEIVQKCNGLPLAIKAVGAVLSRKCYISKEWKRICDSSALSIIKDPTTRTEGGVMGSIYLSYQDALPQLKQCFLYLSLFPVDFLIEQHFVTQLWISEGFVDTKNDQSLQKIVDKYDSVRKDGSSRNKKAPNQQSNAPSGMAGYEEGQQDITQNDNLDSDKAPNQQSNAPSGTAGFEEGQQDITQNDNLDSDKAPNQQSNAPSGTAGYEEGQQDITQNDNLDSDKAPNQQSNAPSGTAGYEEGQQDITQNDNLDSDKGTPCLSSRHSSGRMINDVSSEKRAEKYFKELVGRSFLQQEYKTKGYKMHEQARQIAESLTEHKVFAGDPKDVARLSPSLRHLSFLNKKLTSIPEDVGRLRSLNTLLLSGNPLTEKGLEIIFKNLEFLRVLDLSKTEINSIPKTLGNLLYLRHLNLSHTRIKAIPESIGCLQRLLFLGLQECDNLTFLPKSIQKLSKLKYLDLLGTTLKDPPRLQNLKQVTFLHGFAVDSSNDCPLKDLKKMKELSSLQMRITKSTNKEPKGSEVLKNMDNQSTNEKPEGPEVLENMDNLRELELKCCSTGSPQPGEKEVFKKFHPHRCLESLKIDGYNGCAFPEWLSVSSLPNLRQLTLANCNFCQRLPPLWRLHNLRILTIIKLSKLKTIDMKPGTEEPSFPNLEELCVEDMPDLDTWSVLKARVLRKFHIKSCPMLTDLPDGLENCKELATMEVEGPKLQVLKNLAVQELLVKDLPNLREVSNLPMLKVFTIIKCPDLKEVSVVSSLRHIHIEDEGLDHLPTWLEQHALRIGTMDIVGKEELLERCERNKDDWHIIREIARVYGYLPGRLSFFSYTQSNDFFCKYRRPTEHALQGPPAPTDNSGDNVVPSSSTSHVAKNADSPPRQTQGHDTEKRLTWIWRCIIVILVILICLVFSLFLVFYSNFLK